MENIQNKENWERLLQFLPKDWKVQLKELGALTRKRNIKSEEDLLRILLMYLSDSTSLLETTVVAKRSKIASISDVALLKRLRNSSDFFLWLCKKMLEYRSVMLEPPESFKAYNIITIDASRISEPGSRGTDWTLHYALDLFSLKCKQFIVSKGTVGKTFTNFEVSQDDVFIGDKAYGRYKSMKHVISAGGNFLTRYKSKSYSIYAKDGTPIDLNKKVKGLKIGNILDFRANICTKTATPLDARFCIVKLDKDVGDRNVARAIYEMKKKKQTINPKTVELHQYIILVTSLPDSISGEDILHLYRTRWQIEICFKRLKRIFGLGHLPKKDINSAKAWLYGKLFLAILLQTIADESYLSSPWGYPL